MTPAFIVGEGFCVVWLVITLMSFNLQEFDVLRKITYILYQQLLTQRINFYSTVMSIYLVKLSPYGNAFEGSAPCVHFILTTRQQMKCFYKEWWGQFIPNVFVYLLHTFFNIQSYGEYDLGAQPSQPRGEFYNFAGKCHWFHTNNESAD